VLSCLDTIQIDLERIGASPSRSHSRGVMVAGYD
jgi:hypothetical protein